ncbi:NADH-quinone oxidoreductase subunit C [Microbacter margulisiae]|uniref:Ni,Fe-hydrogenase III large subunit n=1 Tax=Microbacter margulisiae TaxID=1350067 RepID=A0A7W5H1Y1_9PORP|nr:NADH-quinone oxidoreductase subunit C [Microbacter margulisiae]MBB3186861.1 Ni,Fe-hydrogenase III large subunit [Microbacter margulisiae]
MHAIVIKNYQRIPFSAIPALPYELFVPVILEELMIDDSCHCVNYVGFPHNDKVQLICCIANDKQHTIYVTSTIVTLNATLPSLTAHKLAFHIFERELNEQFGIQYTDHPWLKPVRYSFNRSDLNKTIANYPFYSIESEELHEVGVGPIHAGIIEPGHFRFICNGEQILHLEIQLGYQHRGIESLFVEKKKILQRATLAENIAGDTVIGHASTFARVWESLCETAVSPALQLERTLALEHERIAIHTGDLSAMCTDLAYQLGSSVFGRLRTPIINYFQEWTGNRFAKGLIRPNKTNFTFTKELATRWHEVISKFEPDFIEMYDMLSDLPSALARMEKTGIVNKETAQTIGMVGMAARASGLTRDIRMSHPEGWTTISHQPVIKRHGDVFSRVQIRKEEALQSIQYIRQIIELLPDADKGITEEKDALPDSFVIGLTEGWRGEICHCAITDKTGNLQCYKIKDPSLHNWLALGLAVRNNEISDFPICNKSFDLSYCGNDL